MKYISLTLFYLIVVLSSCEKQEQAIPAHEAGDVFSNQIELGQNYTEQVYFDLAKNDIISQNNKQDWDLSFESSREGTHVILNSSKAMASISLIEVIH